MPRRPLPLDCLRTFEAVARLLSFSAAAEELNLTQPAISRQIKGLEEELGAPLFTRATRRVELTGAGQMLLRAVEPALVRIDASVRQIRLSRSRAMVSVTTFPSFASLWLMPRLPDFERDHPLADIRIAATDRMIETDDAELDVALRHCDASKAPEGAIRLFGELLTPVIGARLADAIERGSAPPLAPAEFIERLDHVDMRQPARPAASRSPALAALSAKSSRSMSPLGADFTTTTFIPHICADAGLVPWALTGIRQMSRSSPRAL